MSRQTAAEKKENCEYLLKLLSSVRFLARQGLAFRGDGDDAMLICTKLLVLCGEDYSPMSKFLLWESLMMMIYVLSVTFTRKICQGVT